MKRWDQIPSVSYRFSLADIELATICSSEGLEPLLWSSWLLYIIYKYNKQVQIKISNVFDNSWEPNL